MEHESGQVPHNLYYPVSIILSEQTLREPCGQIDALMDSFVLRHERLNLVVFQSKSTP